MAVRTVTCKLTGQSHLGFSAPIATQNENNEHHDKFEGRTWRERMHTDPEGYVYLQQTSIKNCLVDVATYLGEKVKGKGSKTWTKFFTAGLASTHPLELFHDNGRRVEAAKVEGTSLFVPSDGKRGGPKRVWKTFPVIPPGWTCDVSLLLYEQLLIEDPEKVRDYLEHGGKFIGLGFYRPIRNGDWGRFAVSDFKAGEILGDLAPKPEKKKSKSQKVKTSK